MECADVCRTCTAPISTYAGDVNEVDSETAREESETRVQLSCALCGQRQREILERNR